MAFGGEHIADTVGSFHRTIEDDISIDHSRNIDDNARATHLHTTLLALETAMMGFGMRSSGRHGTRMCSVFDGRFGSSRVLRSNVAMRRCLV